MMPGRQNYVLDDVVILYRLCMVYRMDAAHNMSVRSVAGPEQKLVLLCLQSRSFRIRILTCFKRIITNAGAKLQIKNEIFLRSSEKVLFLTIISHVFN